MQNINELTNEEINTVGGAMSIVEELLERFPFGEFCGGSFYPNGCPLTPVQGPYTASF